MLLILFTTTTATTSTILLLTCVLLCVSSFWLVKRHVAKMRILVSWDVTWHGWMCGSQCSFWNTGKHLPRSVASPPRWSETSISPLCKPQTLHVANCYIFKNLADKLFAVCELGFWSHCMILTLACCFLLGKVIQPSPTLRWLIENHTLLKVFVIMVNRPKVPAWFQSEH